MSVSKQVGMIFISREKKVLNGGMAIKVFIDGKKVGQLANGEEAGFQVEPGTRVLQLKITFTAEKVMAIEVKPNETVRLVCRANFMSISLDYGNAPGSESGGVGVSGGIQNVTTKPSPLRIIGEENIEQYCEIIDTEEFPLDNRSGSDVLSIELEVSKTASIEVSIEKSTEYSSNIGLGLLSLLKAEVSTKLSEQTGQVIGQTITRRQTLRFNVKPHTFIVYLVVWKRKVRTGSYVVLANGQQTIVPYRMCHDLTYEIKTRESAN